jgi:two-component system, chemotaxis family, CheB/CheR fusion protein
LRDANGRIVGTTGIFRDVTEQTRAEEKIREAVRRRDQFLAMLTHELQNPLGAIVSATAFLKADGASEPRANKFLDLRRRDDPPAGTGRARTRRWLHPCCA